MHYAVGMQEGTVHSCNLEVHGRNWIASSGVGVAAVGVSSVHENTAFKRKSTHQTMARYLVMRFDSSAGLRGNRANSRREIPYC